jgi:type IV pilus biogenesis protein CpaD/CtpE
MRAVVVAALVTVLVGCAPRDPVTYAQMNAQIRMKGCYQAVTRTRPALSS